MLRLLDLFCGEGGGAVGYARLGFRVTGVDRRRQIPQRFPFHYYRDDALDYVARYGHEYDAIHASPPCQAYTRGNAGRETDHPRLIAATRAALQATGRPYVIENVADAASELDAPVTLCGCMFDLATIDDDGIVIHLQRERLFETSFPLSAPRPCDHTFHDWVAGSYDGGRRDKFDARGERHGGYVPPSKDVVRALLGIPHRMTWRGLFDALPPAFTQHVGSSLLAAIEDAA